MVSYVLNAVNMTSLVVNSIVLLALVKMKHRQEWPREAYNFFALFSCLLGNIVCLDTQKIIMRLNVLNVADPSTCYWLGVTTILLEIIRLWLIAFLSMESFAPTVIALKSLSYDCCQVQLMDFVCISKGNMEPEDFMAKQAKQRATCSHATIQT